MFVGTVVALNQNTLGNPKDAVGVVYDEYYLSDKAGKGVSVIFPNGNYDGFSVEEQISFLREVGYCPGLADYQFTNVIKLSQDFRNGVFQNVWKSFGCRL